jgi:hypothetical protein
MHNIQCGSATYQYQAAQEKLIACAGLYNITNLKALNFHPVLQFSERSDSMNYLYLIQSIAI